MSDTERSLEAEQKNGVYLLSVENVYEGFIVRSATDEVHVSGVTINGNYVGADDYFETECNDYTIEDDELTLWYMESDTQQEES
jgi:hypothetical protein